MLRSGGGTPGPAGPAGATGAPGAPGGENGSYLVSGGGIFWKGTGFQYTVAAATYVIQGVQYSSVQTDITLTAADGSNDRIDLFALTTSSTAIKIDGTAASAPAEPVPDPLTQLKLSSAYVATGATSATIGTTSIYAENTEWTTSQVGGTITLASTNNPNGGTKCVEATSSIAGDYALFTNSGAFDTSTRNMLFFYIRSKASWASQKTLVIQWYSSTTAKGSPVALKTGVYGFNSSTTGSYQLIGIPLSAFAVSGLSVDRIRFTITGGGSAIGFYLDDISMQGGVQQNVTSNGMVWRGAYSSAVQYVANDVVSYNGSLYIARQSLLGVTPGGTGWTQLMAASSGARVFNGRLTLESNVATSAADNTAKTNIYFTPYIGDQISLYDGSSTWNTRTFTELTLALGTLTDATIYDLFLYDNSGTVAFDTPVAWRNSGQAITGATAATPIVITANSHGLSNGDQVYISGVNGVNANGTWTVANKATNTFELSGSVGSGSYVNGGYLSARGTLLTTQNGVLVKTGATTRLYIGSFKTTSTTTTESSVTKRFLWNFFNRTATRAIKADGTSHTYATASSRFWNNDANSKVQFIVGYNLETVNSHLEAQVQPAAGVETYVLQALDGPGAGYTGVDSWVSGSMSTGTLFAHAGVSQAYFVSPGMHFIGVYEIGSATGTNTFPRYCITAGLWN